MGVTEATGGRRELRKAQTRTEVRATAQRLFAERGFDEVTIADVAAAADVAVQTVFNHFESKEALFFDGRTPWVEGSAVAVAQRAPGTDPVGALRRYVEQQLTYVLHQETRPENRGYIEVLEGSPGLQSRERDAGRAGRTPGGRRAGPGDRHRGWDAAPATDPATARVLSRLIADLFLVAGRSLVLENRRLVLHPELDGADHLSVAATAPATLAAIEDSVRRLAGRLPARAGRDSDRPAPAAALRAAIGTRTSSTTCSTCRASSATSRTRCSAATRTPRSTDPSRASRLGVDRLPPRRRPAADLATAAASGRTRAASSPARSSSSCRAAPTRLATARSSRSSGRVQRRDQRREVGAQRARVVGDGDQVEAADRVPGQRRHGRPAPVDAGLAGPRPGGDPVAVQPPPALLGQDVDGHREQLLGQLGAERPPRRARS